MYSEKKPEQQEPEQAQKQVPTYLGKLKPCGMPKENTHVNSNNLVMSIENQTNKNKHQNTQTASNHVS